MKQIIVTEDAIQKTLQLLQQAGVGRTERVLLWLADRGLTNEVKIKEVYMPIQKVSFDYFRIPRSGMAKLLKHLREKRLVVVAQVHSHPKEAFHSLPDDKWAIVRHSGALSVVLPDFAIKTSVGSFMRDAALYVLSSNNIWEGAMSQNYYRIER